MSGQITEVDALSLVNQEGSPGKARENNISALCLSSQEKVKMNSPTQKVNSEPAGR